MIPMKAYDWVTYKMDQEVDKFSIDGNIINELVMEIGEVAVDDNELKKRKELSENLTFLHIYFKHLGITQYNRDENYGIWDLIGKCIV